MPDKGRTADSKENKDGIFLLTSTGHPFYDSSRQMEMGQQQPKRKKDSRKAAYPLRFNTKSQKERLERAARKTGRSLRGFILYHADIAAESVLAEQKAS